jgi:hypothetical protein
MGYSDMISERKFAESYTSFWREIIPTGEDYIRRINLKLERFDTPIESNLPSQRRALINELAFRLFCVTIKEAKPSIISLPDEVIEEEVKVTSSHILRFKDTKKSITKINEKEKQESIELGNRLLEYFKPKAINSEMILCPEFPGSGIVNTSEGDIILGSILYEIKSGDRSFRLIDLKQTLIYCALNYGRQKYNIDKISLLNPRLGLYFIESIDDVALAVSGSSSSYLLWNIIEFASRSTDSR